MSTFKVAVAVHGFPGNTISSLQERAYTVVTCNRVANVPGITFRWFSQLEAVVITRIASHVEHTTRITFCSVVLGYNDKELPHDRQLLRDALGVLTNYPPRWPGCLLAIRTPPKHAGRETRNAPVAVAWLLPRAL